MLVASGIGVAFEGVAALANADLSVAEGETMALLGPSGCGKSTLLRVIAGLQPPDSGRIVIAGSDVTPVPTHRRGVGLMIQGDTLFPHRNVAQNVGFGLRMARRSRTEIERRVAELLELVGLAGFGSRDPAGLSGGERQRVALARALAPSPRVLLLDEPLASLDRPLRERLLSELEQLFAHLGLTVVYVTHDVGEAFALGHRVAVMRRGRIAQVDVPDGLWARPADAWVARFLGLANVVDEGAHATVTRAEAVSVGQSGAPATVLSVARQGSVVRLRVRLDSGRELDALTTALDHPAPGARVGVEIDPAGVIDVPGVVTPIRSSPEASTTDRGQRD
jgi:thiamine transport system ATP-binding protein